ENHNLRSTVCWESDAEFRKINIAFDKVNDFVSINGIERSARLVVLRPHISDYRPEEIEAIGLLLREATSDIWWMPYSRARKYAFEDFVVIGNEKLLRLRCDLETPLGVASSGGCSEDAVRATQLRTEIANEISYATPIKAHG